MGAQTRNLVKQQASAKMREEALHIASRMHDNADLYASTHLPVLAEKGIVSSCKAGCGACCHQEILLPRPEADLMVNHLRAHLAPADMAALQTRLSEWLRWVREVLPGLLKGNSDWDHVYYNEGPGCPLLIDNNCSAYPVRPLTCRLHYVSSPPERCLRDKDEGYVDDKVEVITEISRQSFGEDLNNFMVSCGHSFAASVHRLPEWLAHLFGVEREPWLATPWHMYSNLKKMRCRIGKRRI